MRWSTLQDIGANADHLKGRSLVLPNIIPDGVSVWFGPLGWALPKPTVRPEAWI
jgi:hypothetical protein